MRRRIKELCDQGRLREALDCVSRIEPGSDLCKTDSLRLIAGQVLSSSINSERNEFLAKIVAIFLWLGNTEEATRYLLEVDDLSVAERFSEIIERTIRAYQDEQLITTV